MSDCENCCEGTFTCCFIVIALGSIITLPPIIALPFLIIFICILGIGCYNICCKSQETPEGIPERTLERTPQETSERTFEEIIYV